MSKFAKYKNIVIGQNGNSVYIEVFADKAITTINFDAKEARKIGSKILQYAAELKKDEAEDDEITKVERKVKK